MLPQMPKALNPDFAAAGDVTAVLAEPSVEHHCQVCPTCSQELQGHRCKLVCLHCGYYMSCADYY